MEATEVLTIGHSTLLYERFSELLRQANVTAIVDVRSAPYSRQFPQFNREIFRMSCGTDGIAYVFLGKESGGGPRSPSSTAMGLPTTRRCHGPPNSAKDWIALLKGQRSIGLRLCVLSATRWIATDVSSWAGPWFTAAFTSATSLVMGRVVSHSEIEDKLMELSGRDTEDLLPLVRKDWQRRIANARGRSRSLSRSPIPAARSPRSDASGQGNRFDDRVH